MLLLLLLYQKFFERDSAAKVDSNFQGGRVEALLHHGSPLRMLNHNIHMVSLSAYWVVGSWVDLLKVIFSQAFTLPDKLFCNRVVGLSLKFTC